jgi:hypothetical protein
VPLTFEAPLLARASVPLTFEAPLLARASVPLTFEAPLRARCRFPGERSGSAPASFAPERPRGVLAGREPRPLKAPVEGEAGERSGREAGLALSPATFVGTAGFQAAQAAAARAGDAGGELHRARASLARCHCPRSRPARCLGAIAPACGCGAPQQLALTVCCAPRGEAAAHERAAAGAPAESREAEPLPRPPAGSLKAHIQAERAEAARQRCAQRLWLWPLRSRHLPRKGFGRTVAGTRPLRAQPGLTRVAACRMDVEEAAGASHALRVRRALSNATGPLEPLFGPDGRPGRRRSGAFVKSLGARDSGGSGRAAETCPPPLLLSLPVSLLYTPPPLRGPCRVRRTARRCRAPGAAVGLASAGAARADASRPGVSQGGV